MSAKVRESGPIPKEAPVRSEAYRRAVASLRCYRCKIEGFSQACHGDADKGMQRKTDDLTCWPGCGERPGIPGCHYYVSRVMPRDERRAFEIDAAKDTIACLIFKGQETGREAQALRRTLIAAGLVKA